MNFAEARNSKSTIETLLIALFFLGLLFALFDVMKAFVGVLTFALIFSVSFSGLFEKFVLVLKGRRKLAAFIYAFLLIAIVAQPFVYLISSLSHHLKDIVHTVNDVKQNGLPPLPAGVSNMPLIGEPVAEFYKNLQEEPKATLAEHEKPDKNGVAGYCYQRRRRFRCCVRNYFRHCHLRFLFAEWQKNDYTGCQCIKTYFR